MPMPSTAPNASSPPGQPLPMRATKPNSRPRRSRVLKWSSVIVFSSVGMARKLPVWTNFFDAVLRGSIVMYLLNGSASASSDVTLPFNAANAYCPSIALPALVPPTGMPAFTARCSAVSSAVPCQLL
jgi:hypothetical protein